MVNVPQNIYKAVKPYVQCPDPIWEGVVQYESNFNPNSVGDGPQYGGYSYGLFQLHVADNGQAQGNRALTIIQKEQGLTGQAAITYLLQHSDIQARVGMPPINDAWNHLKNSYDPMSVQWWTQFCSMSGHPGGNAQDPVTQRYVTNFMTRIVKSNAFGIQQVAQGANESSGQHQDNTWLQSLINMPPNQPCSVIWRRTCPGAKNANEGGMDLPSPNGTKVYALGAGKVIGAGYFWHADGTYGYGVVTIRTTMPDGSMADIYYQHLQLSQNIVLCGQTGGQLYGGVKGPAPTGQIITQGQYLGDIVVNEVEVGVNAEWGGIWGTNHPGAWADDPEPYIRALMDNGGGAGPQFPFTTGNAQYDAYLQSAFTTAHTTFQTVTQVKGIGGPLQAFDNAQKFKPFAVPDDNSAAANWPVIGGTIQGASYPSRLALGVINFMVKNTFAFFVRSIFVILAMVVIIALIINAVSHTTETVAGDEGGEGGNMLPSQGGGGSQVGTAMKVAELAAL